MSEYGEYGEYGEDEHNEGATPDVEATRTTTIALVKVRGEVPRLDYYVDLDDLMRQDEAWKNRSARLRQEAREEARLLRDEERRRQARRARRRAGTRGRGPDGE